MMNQNNNFQNNNMNNMINKQGFNNIINPNQSMFNVGINYNHGLNMNMSMNNMQNNNNKSNMNNMQIPSNMMNNNNKIPQFNINNNKMNNGVNNINNNNINLSMNNMQLHSNMNIKNDVNFPKRGIQSMNMMNNNMNNNNFNNKNFQMNNANNQFNNNMNNQMSNLNQNNLNFQKNVVMNNQGNNMNMNNMNKMNNQINNNKPNANVNNMNNFGINYDFMNNNNNNNNNNLQNMEQNNYIIYIRNQLNTIIQQNFNSNIFGNIQTEQQILSHFSFVEKQCFNFINSNMCSKEIFTEYIFEELRNIFNNNQYLNHKITNQIISKINTIEFGTFKSTEQYYDSLKNYFGNVEIPQFLIKKNLDALQGFLIYLNRNDKTTNIINNMKNKNFQNNTKLILDYYDKLKNNMMQPFEGINKKYELFCLFLCTNRSLFFKNYYDEKFLNILEWNIDIIRYYFGSNITFQGICQYMNQMNGQGIGQNNTQNNILNQADIIFNNISFMFNNNINIICNIIASFYRILFYKFKNIYKNDSIHNMNNTHLSIALKNFVIFLSQKCTNFANSGINLFQLLTDLISYDVNNLVNLDRFYEPLNKEYNFNDVDSILQDNQRYKELKTNNIDKYMNDLDDGVFTLIKKNWKNCGYIEDFNLYFKLKPIDKEVISNSITLLIDGAEFLNINYKDKFNWGQFISKFNGETNFYQLCWPNKVFDLKQNSKEKQVHKKIRTLKFVAKTCGKLLGYILHSEKFFGNFQINLVGLNYGCFIVKNCLKELQKLNNLEHNKKIYIKNVVFIDGAINFKNKINWTQIFENLIVDKIINCFSRVDNINDLLNNYGLSNQTIGNKGLGIGDVGAKYIKYEHDLTDFDFGKDYYDLSIPANLSFASYNDL